MKKLLIAVALLCVMVSCTKQAKTDEKVIGKPNIEVKNGQFTPEVMWALGKMGEKAVSPDGKQIAYTVTYYDIGSEFVVP